MLPLELTNLYLTASVTDSAWSRLDFLLRLKVAGSPQFAFINQCHDVSYLPGGPSPHANHRWPLAALASETVLTTFDTKIPGAHLILRTNSSTSPLIDFRYSVTTKMPCSGCDRQV